MTISNGTAQTLLLTPAAPAPDGQFSAPPIAIDPGQPGMPAAILAEGEFWTLVSQSLAEEGLELQLNWRARSSGARTSRNRSSCPVSGWKC